MEAPPKHTPAAQAAATCIRPTLANSSAPDSGLRPLSVVLEPLLARLRAAASQGEAAALIGAMYRRADEQAGRQNVP